MSSSTLILGCGVSGKAAARLALSLGMETFIADESDSPGLRRDAESLSSFGAKPLIGWRHGDTLPNADTTVVSPGMPESSPLLRSALASGVPAISELEFGFRALDCPVAAITGTNGKTTTTELATSLFRSIGVNAESAGNIGVAMSEAAIGAQGRGLAMLVAEVSSFQLERVDTFAPCSAAILNLASDHINRHGGMDAYAKEKFKIFARMKPEARRMSVNSNLLGYWSRHGVSGVSPATFSAAQSADFSCKDGVLCFMGRGILEFNACQLKGPHNAENILAALAVLRGALGDEALFDKRICDAAASFRPAPHRLELFAERDGIRYVNDSKATNPHSVNAALKAFGGSKDVLLILGGLDKGMDFTPIKDDADKVRKAFIMGECGELLRRSIEGCMECELCASFEEAVEKACKAAASGDTVMLSPACASMDMFANYKERGEAFKRIVMDFLCKI